jgi:hypothetical protein
MLVYHQPPQPQPPQPPQPPQGPPQPPPQKACAWWVATSGADANSTSTASMANAQIAIVFCFVDIIRTFLLDIVVYVGSRSHMYLLKRDFLSFSPSPQ